MPPEARSDDIQLWQFIAQNDQRDLTEIPNIEIKVWCQISFLYVNSLLYVEWRIWLKVKRNLKFDTKLEIYHLLKYYVFIFTFITFFKDLHSSLELSFWQIIKKFEEFTRETSFVKFSRFRFWLVRRQGFVENSRTFSVSLFRFESRLLILPLSCNNQIITAMSC